MTDFQDMKSSSLRFSCIDCQSYLNLVSPWLDPCCVTGGQQRCGLKVWGLICYLREYITHVFFIVFSADFRAVAVMILTFKTVWSFLICCFCVGELLPTSCLEAIPPRYVIPEESELNSKLASRTWKLLETLVGRCWDVGAVSEWQHVDVLRVPLRLFRSSKQFAKTHAGKFQKNLSRSSQGFVKKLFSLLSLL